ncbi:MAG: flagellar biosynthetic protein FliQ [Armatimonadetes bacterium]|nr:flagellar biosynthetic protein FliQ [Armatimonadota bacterium]
MNHGIVLDLTRQGIIVSMMVTLPILAVALFVGLAVSIFQAVTQVQEMTLTYLPKLLGCAAVLTGMGSWMLTILVKFMVLCFDQITKVTQ